MELSLIGIILFAAALTYTIVRQRVYDQQPNTDKKHYQQPNTDEDDKDHKVLGDCDEKLHVGSI